MALTGAERQIKHREKMRAEGKMPNKIKKAVVKTTPEKLAEKRRKATERQQRRRQRLRDEMSRRWQRRMDGDMVDDVVIQQEKLAEKRRKATERQQKRRQRLQDEKIRHWQPRMDGDMVRDVVIQEEFEMEGSKEKVIVDGCSGSNHEDEHNATDPCGDAFTPEHLAQQRDTESHWQPSMNDTVVDVTIKKEPEFEMHSCEEHLNVAGESYTDQPSEIIPYSDQFGYIEEIAYQSLDQEKLQRRRQNNAERQRRRRARMREEGIYEMYKQKHVIHCEKHRAVKRELENSLPESVRREFIAKRREDGRRRVAQYRARKKQMALEIQQSMAAAYEEASGKVCVQTVH